MASASLVLAALFLASCADAVAVPPAPAVQHRQIVRPEPKNADLKRRLDRVQKDIDKLNRKIGGDNTLEAKP
jgi:hypothetical protein